MLSLSQNERLNNMTTKMFIDEIKLLDCRYSMKDIEEEDTSSDDDVSPVNMDIVCGNNYIKDDRRLIITLEVNCHAPSLPFSFNVKYGASYTLSQDPDDDELDRFVNVICPFQIMPYIREFVSELTRKAGNEPLFIPPMNFIAMDKERKKNDASALENGK